LNQNINLQLKTVLNIGPEIDILSGLLPIRFNVSAIGNNKQGSNIKIDESIDTMNPRTNDSTPGVENNVRTCNIIIDVNEGPKGDTGDAGIDGKKGTNTTGPDGIIGNVGYWGTTR
jgi:hypothetical protein